MIIYQYKNGYRYNSDSLILYDFIRRDKPRGKGLDIGCGSGILSVLASEFEVVMDAIDIQEINADLTNLNFKANKLNYQAQAISIDEYCKNNYYDFCISNPPFYSKMHASNAHLDISRHADFMPLESFLSAANRLLKPKGYLYFCYDAKKIDAIFSILSQTRLKCERIRFVHAKSDKLANLVLIKARKNSKSDLAIEPALICYDGTQASEQMNNIYQNIKVQSYDLS